MNEIITGDCLHEMAKMEVNSISCIVTDPPYGLHFMGKDWDSFKKSDGADYSARRKDSTEAVSNQAGTYDDRRNDEFQLFIAQFGREALRIVKPGGYLLMFGSPRRHHRQMSGLEDAGWEIRDCLMWVFGQGFPKSHNFGCKCTGDAVPYNHEKITESNSESCMRSLPETDLSSSFSACTTENETMFKIMQEQGLQNDGAMSFQGFETGKESSVEGGNHIQKEQGELYRSQVCEVSNGIHGNGKEGWLCNGTPSSDGEVYEQATKASGSSSPQRSQHKEQQHRKSGVVSRQSDSQDCGMGTCQKCGGLIAFKRWGTALKPAYEPIIMAMKPCDGTFKNNAEKWGQAGINIDGCRIETQDDLNGGSYGNKSSIDKNTFGFGFKPGKAGEFEQPKGRWPANILFDEEAAKMLDEQSGNLKGNTGIKGTFKGQRHNGQFAGGGDSGNREYNFEGYHDIGGASRFFYCSKASSSERNGGLDNLPLKDPETHYGCTSEGRNVPKHGGARKNNHPTVKPLKLMEYLIKLIMPPKNGILLDPFAGSGTTILAAKRLGFNAIGIEKCEEYSKIARARLK